MQKFVEISSRERNHEKENDWYTQCQEKAVPFITVKTRTRLADVHWDYITYSMEVDSILRDKKKFIESSAEEIYRKYATDKSTGRVSAHLIYFNNLEIHAAKRAASELYDFIDGLVSSPDVAKGSTLSDIREAVGAISLDNSMAKDALLQKNLNATMMALDRQRNVIEKLIALLKL